jgi:hypothetical protein
VNALPNIVVPELPQAIENKPFMLSAMITDDELVTIASITFRFGGDTISLSVPMANTGNDSVYQFTFPAGFITNRGIEFFIEATDNSGTSTRMPTSTFKAISVRVNGIGMSEAQPGGSEQTAYRLISVPLELDNKTPGAVLEDNLGAYDKTKWRFFELNANQQTIEFPNTGEMVPGKAFWLLVKDAGKSIDTGTGITVPTDQPFEIPLNAGWNFIATPFNFSIPIENIRLKSGDEFKIGFYRSFWDTVSVDTLEPFEGYIVMNDVTTDEDTLLIDPDLTPETGLLLSKLSSSNSEDKFDWSIQIMAQSQEARDINNWGGVSENASSNWDLSDFPEPPFVGEYVSVYFPHPEWEKPIEVYTKDVRSPVQEGHIWDFEVKTNFTDEVKLTFEDLETVPEEFEIWLSDKLVNVTQNLRENNHYSVAGRGEKHPKQLKLVVGNPGFVETTLAEFQLIPKDFELSQNFPNPFNPSTTIPYALPQAEKVTLVIYNVLGQKVTTLADKLPREAGYHAVIWDGRNDGGVKVASGVYFLRMQAGKFVKTRKMLLIE